MGDPLRLVLEIDRGSPLAGRLGEDGASGREFSGWSGLASAIAGLISSWEKGAAGGAAGRPEPPEA